MIAPVAIAGILIMAILANQASAYSSNKSTIKATKVITATIKPPNTQDTEMFELAILEMKHRELAILEMKHRELAILEMKHRELAILDRAGLVVRQVSVTSAKVALVVKQATVNQL